MDNETIIVELIKGLLALGLFIMYGYFQSIVINGIHAASVGDTTIDPDGKERHGEMILYPLRRFIMQHDTEIIYYKGEELRKLREEINEKFPSLHWSRYTGLTYKSEDAEGFSRIVKTFKSYDPQIKLDFNPDGYTIHPYKEFKKYRFNKYIRKPIIQCIVCMPSFWTIFLFWIPAFLYLGFSFLLIPVGILNVFMVSYLSFLNYKAV